MKAWARREHPIYFSGTVAPWQLLLEQKPYENILANTSPSSILMAARTGIVKWQKDGLA
jgi:hypothetical protein